MSGEQKKKRRLEALEARLAFLEGRVGALEAENAMLKARVGTLDGGGCWKTVPRPSSDVEWPDSDGTCVPPSFAAPQTTCFSSGSV